MYEVLMLLNKDKTEEYMKVIIKEESNAETK